MPGDKHTTAARFDAAAPDYLESDAHHTGADLETLAPWCADADRALDVAPGAGHTAGALGDAGVGTVVATDTAPAMVATAVETYGVEGCVADAERLPFATETFDAVSCRIAAHHFPAPEQFVAEAARVLAPGGVLALEDNVAPRTPVCRPASTRSNGSATRPTSAWTRPRCGVGGSRPRG